MFDNKQVVERISNHICSTTNKIGFLAEQLLRLANVNVSDIVVVNVFGKKELTAGF